MILIFSIDYETSTSIVEEWLLHYGGIFFRINETTFITDIDYTTNRLTVNTNLGKQVDFSKVKSVWFRRGRLQVKFALPKNIDKAKYAPILDNEKQEAKALSDFLINKLSEKKCISDFSNMSPNKLMVLEMAKSIGLEIPDTIITTKKESIKNYFKNRKIINKNISDVVHCNIDKKVYYNRTTEIYSNKIPVSFSPSCIQQMIEKKYELRIFYFDGRCYSMAIFSQSNKKTNVDFRNYDYKNPNREVPFILPATIEKKLKKLMKKLKLNTGSIDIIVTPDNKYIFLEVYPVGQFGMVSVPCNYQLEKLIAAKLMRA